MAFDPENHVIDEKGFQRHKETGHLVGIEAMPAHRVTDEAEWPKWVRPHPNHIHREKRGDFEHISTPQFTEHHIRRHDGEVTVLVHSAEEAALALADPRAEAPMGA